MNELSGGEYFHSESSNRAVASSCRNEACGNKDMTQLNFCRFIWQQNARIGYDENKN